MFRNLPPQGQEALLVGGGFGCHFLVVVNVQDDHQILLQCPADDFIEPGKEGWFDGVGGFGEGVGVPAGGNADTIKPGRPDELEVFRRDCEAPFALARCFERVAHVDAAPHLADGLEGRE